MAAAVATRLEHSSADTDYTRCMCVSVCVCVCVCVCVRVCVSPAPDSVTSPSLESISSSSVLVSWSTPAQPNGIITQFIVQRRPVVDSSESGASLTVAVVRRVDHSIRTYDYLDESVELRPFTVYEYRVAAQTIAGLTYSSWSSVVTRSARALLSCLFAVTCFCACFFDRGLVKPTFD